jgi:hypothetical protein
VFIDDGGVVRGLSTVALADFEALAASHFYGRALDGGDIVGTERDDAAAAELPGEWVGALRHERIETLSFPYEWSFEMLRDAARLQLRLTREALAEKLITKDASPYNVQFVGTKPVFIDVGSFERLHGSEPWRGYRQFCELFLNPLLVQALRDIPFQPWLRGRIHGIPPTVAADALQGSGRLQKGVFTHVKLHARAERKASMADLDRDVNAELERAGYGPAVIDAMLNGLQKSVEELAWKQQRSTWSEYSERGHYADESLAAKDRFVEETVGTLAQSGVVLDLGANDGRFSRIAVDSGARAVVAVDSDHVVVDRLYRELRSKGERRILPLVIDLSDPSPAIGWRSRERPAFVDRVRPDLVLCLAVVHHLALTNTVPLDEIVAFLADFGAPVVVEFPHRDDQMARLLLSRKRSGIFDSYEVLVWERALAERFVVQRREVLPGGTRTLYQCDLR